MAYEPTNWKTGDVVTSAKLNKLENAVANGGGVLVVHDNEGTLDATWQQIKDAGFAVLNIENTIGLLFSIVSAKEYSVAFATFTSSGFDEPIAYTANNPTDELVMVG